MYDSEKKDAAARFEEEIEAELDREIKRKARKNAVIVLVLGVCLAVGLGIKTKDIGVSIAACVFDAALLMNCYVPVFTRYMGKTKQIIALLRLYTIRKRHDSSAGACRVFL